MISQQFDRPVCINRYPSAIKAFYMKPDPVRPEVALGVDVIAPEGYGEIIGGGERLADYDLLLQRIEEHKLPKEAFDWYLDLRRYGSVPHAGFGMGIERCVSLDLRPRPRPRNHPLPAHALPPVPLTPSGVDAGPFRRRSRAVGASIDRRTEPAVMALGPCGHLIHHRPQRRAELGQAIVDPQVARR